MFSGANRALDCGDERIGTQLADHELKRAEHGLSGKAVGRDDFGRAA